MLLLLISNSVSNSVSSTPSSSNSQTLPTYLMINGGKKKDLGLFTMIRAFWLTLINPEVTTNINIKIIFIILLTIYMYTLSLLE